jgi:hypothetical protein
MEKPKIKLNLLEKTVVETPTQESFNRVLRICELADRGWFSLGGPLATEGYFRWSKYEQNTCLCIDNKIGFADKKTYIKAFGKTISEEDFYNINGIIPEQREQSERYFKLLNQNIE